MSRRRQTRGHRVAARVAPVLACSLALAAGSGVDADAAAPDGAVPVVRLAAERADGGRVPASGFAFFLALDNRAGAAGIASAGALDPARLSRLRAVVFRAGARGRAVARSRGLLVAPGSDEAPSEALVFHLEAAPDGAQPLEPQREAGLGRALRVEIPGPQSGALGWGRTARVEGSVVSHDDRRIRVDLDRVHDLRGWEGAPVIASLTGRVIGMLLPTDARGAERRAEALPIDAVLRALEHPLAGGAGSPFASLGPGGAARADGVETPPRVESATEAEPLIRPELTPTRVRVDVEVPDDGAAVDAAGCGVFVSGRSRASAGPAKRFDVVFVLDTSGSTAAASGADIDGDGVVGHSKGASRDYLGAPSSDPGDSILAAEVAAARLVLARLEPASTRVAVVRFAGRAGSWPGAETPAVTQVGLTDDYARVRRALAAVEALGPSGQTHMAAGVQWAVRELTGGPGGLSPAQPDRERVVFFFTDGQPTLPYALPFVHDNVATVLEAADAARAAGITIHTFALGPEALAGPLGPIELADRTGGTFTPVRQPADLLHVVADVHLADVERVELRNLTNGRFAHHLRVNADGPWSGLVPVQKGWNEIEVVARASDGAEARSTLRVESADGAAPQSVPASWNAQYEDLLRACLAELREANRAAERAYLDRVRQRLVVEIEAERARARERAARQRKELEIHPEAAPGTGAAPPDHSRR